MLFSIAAYINGVVKGLKPSDIQLERQYLLSSSGSHGGAVVCPCNDSSSNTVRVAPSDDVSTHFACSSVSVDKQERHLDVGTPANLQSTSRLSK